MLGGLGLDLLRLDEFGLFTAVLGNLEGFGLPGDLNISSFCLAVAPDAPGGLNDGCSGFAFFDDIHPTAQLQALLAAEAMRAVGIPEPGTIGILLIGLAGLGLRRRVAKSFA